MPATFEDKDTGWKRFMDTIRKIDPKTQISIGVFGDKDTRVDEGDISNLELAIIHEFGTRDGHVPERSFIRSTMDENAERYIGMLVQMAPMVLNGTLSEEKALQLIAVRIVADIKNRITSGIDPENAPSTIKRKGSSKPLVDTAQMLNAISYEVK